MASTGSTSFVVPRCCGTPRNGKPSCEGWESGSNLTMPTRQMDNSYMETVWCIFKDLHAKGLIYEGKRILLYCPRCETPLSKFEIAMDNSYRNVVEKAVVVKFRIAGADPCTSILAWTTTPWTLVGNVALAVNSKLDYVKVRVGDECLVLAKSALRVLTTPFEVIEECKGNELLGLEYEPLYALNEVTNGYLVVDGEEGVTADEGTGVVHLAAYGEFDLDMIQKHGLSLVQAHLRGSPVKTGP